MGRLFNRGEAPQTPDEPSNELYRLPTAREMIERAGIKFNFIIDPDNTPVPALDEEGIKELAEAARQRLEQEK